MTVYTGLVLTVAITVQILAKYDLSAVDVLERGQWVTLRAPLDQAVTLTKPSIRVPGRDPRTYPGSVTVTSRNGKLVFLNDVKETDYLQGVLAGEAETSAPEALAALAIAARSMIPFLAGRHQDADVCDLTHCQVYVGRVESPVIERAVADTEGCIVLWQGKPALTPYHSTCGGMTSPASGFFDSNTEHLRGISDEGLCSSSPHYRWEAELDETVIEKIVGHSVSPGGLEVKGTNRSGRVERLNVGGHHLSGVEFYRRAGAVLGWNIIKSTWFTIEHRGQRYRFRGRGLGHGVGLCQWGAEALARRGKTAEEILRYYFPGTTLSCSR